MNEFSINHEKMQLFICEQNIELVFFSKALNPVFSLLNGLIMNNGIRNRVPKSQQAGVLKR